MGEPDGRAAAGDVWDAFLGDLRTAGWAIGLAGAVVAAAAASLIRPVAIEGPLRALWRVATTEPRRRGCGRAPAALVAVGALVVARRY